MKKTNAIEQRRKAFAEYVAAGKSACEAARLAGYKAKGHGLEVVASRLLSHVEVQLLIQAAASKASNARVFDAAARREILRQIATGEVEQEIITKTSGPMGDTEQVQKRRPTGAERAAAIKHLDELDGLMVQKIQHAGPNGQPLTAVLATVPEDEIRKRLAELAKRKTK